MSEPASTLRGSVIRVPGGQPGLIVANGRQWPFEIAGVWLSPVAPALNQTVDVTLDQNGAIVGITVVAGSQQAAEKLKQAAGAATAWAQGEGKEKLTKVLGEAGRGAEAAKNWVASQSVLTRHRKPILIGAAVLVALVCIFSIFGGGSLESRVEKATIQQARETRKMLDLMDSISTRSEFIKAKPELERQFSRLMAPMAENMRLGLEMQKQLKGLSEKEKAEKLKEWQKTAERLTREYMPKEVWEFANSKNPLYGVAYNLDRRTDGEASPFFESLLRDEMKKREKEFEPLVKELYQMPD